MLHDTCKVDARAGLQRAEDAVARIAQAGDDVAVFVEAVIDGGDVDGDVGMRCIDGAHAFRRGDETEEHDALRALFFSKGRALRRNCRP